MKTPITESFTRMGSISDSSSSSTTSSKSHKKIRNKYISHRRGSLAADLGDDDDMQNEIDRLNEAQVELQRELMNVMKMVETMQAVEDSSTAATTTGESSSATSASLQTTSGIEKLDLTAATTNSWGGLIVEEEEPGRSTKKTFSQGFFEFVVSQQPKESLESQKKRQMEIVKENLKNIEPGLENVADCHRQTQEIIVLEQKQLEELRVKNYLKLERLLKAQPRTLFEEKERQQDIFKLSLDPVLVQQMEIERSTQEALLKKKEKELETTKLLMHEKMQELTSSDTPHQKQERFWSAPRRHLEAMLGRKKKDQIEQSTRHLNGK